MINLHYHSINHLSTNKVALVILNHIEPSLTIIIGIGYQAFKALLIILSMLIAQFLEQLSSIHH